MKWLAIETAPKDNVAIIVASLLGEKIVHVRMAVWNGLGWYEVYSGAGINYVTHWIPIPELPARKETLDGLQRRGLHDQE